MELLPDLVLELIFDFLTPHQQLMCRGVALRWNYLLSNRQKYNQQCSDCLQYINYRTQTVYNSNILCIDWLNTKNAHDYTNFLMTASYKHMYYKNINYLFNITKLYCLSKNTHVRTITIRDFKFDSDLIEGSSVPNIQEVHIQHWYIDQRNCNNITLINLLNTIFPKAHIFIYNFKFFTNNNSLFISYLKQQFNNRLMINYYNHYVGIKTCNNVNSAELYHCLFINESTFFSSSSFFTQITHLEHVDLTLFMNTNIILALNQMPSLILLSCILLPNFNKNYFCYTDIYHHTKNHSQLKANFTKLSLITLQTFKLYANKHVCQLCSSIIMSHLLTKNVHLHRLDLYVQMFNYEHICKVNLAKIKHKITDLYVMSYNGSTEVENFIIPNIQNLTIQLTNNNICAQTIFKFIQHQILRYPQLRYVKFTFIHALLNFDVLLLKNPNTIIDLFKPVTNTIELITISVGLLNDTYTRYQLNVIKEHLKEAFPRLTKLQFCNLYIRV